MLKSIKSMRLHILAKDDRKKKKTRVAWKGDPTIPALPEQGNPASSYTFTCPCATAAIGRSQKSPLISFLPKFFAN